MLPSGAHVESRTRAVALRFPSSPIGMLDNGFYRWGEYGLSRVIDQQRPKFRHSMCARSTRFNSQLDEAGAPSPSSRVDLCCRSSARRSSGSSLCPLLLAGKSFWGFSCSRSSSHRSSMGILERRRRASIRSSLDLGGSNHGAIHGSQHRRRSHWRAARLVDALIALSPRRCVSEAIPLSQTKGGEFGTFAVEFGTHALRPCM